MFPEFGFWLNLCWSSSITYDPHIRWKDNTFIYFFKHIFEKVHLDKLLSFCSVHELRPGDIKVVGTLGDSLTVSVSVFVLLLQTSHVFIEFVWSVWCFCRQPMVWVQKPTTFSSCLPSTEGCRGGKLSLITGEKVRFCLQSSCKDKLLLFSALVVMKTWRQWQLCQVCLSLFLKVWPQIYLF